MIFTSVYPSFYLALSASSNTLLLFAPHAFPFIELYTYLRTVNAFIHWHLLMHLAFSFMLCDACVRHN